MKRNMVIFFVALAFFVSCSGAFAQQNAPVAKKAESMPKKQEAAPKKEEPPLPPKEPSFIPNDNDVKSFVYRWFSWLDHQVEDFLFLYHLSKDGLLMEFPETTVKSQEDFQKWYQNIRNTIKSNRHEVTNLKVKTLANGRFGVELAVRWLATPYEGKPIDKTYKQSWELSLASSGRLTIDRYIVKK